MWGGWGNTTGSAAHHHWPASPLYPSVTQEYEAKVAHNEVNALHYLVYLADQSLKYAHM